MVMTTTKTVSDQFLTMTTRDVPVALAKKMSTPLVKDPVAVSAAAAPSVLAAPVGVTAAGSTASIPRGRLYDLVKMAVAAGVGIVLGAGVMYVYLRSFSNIGKEINSVVQSVNSLKG